MSALEPGDRVKITAYRGSALSLQGEEGRLIQFNTKTWAGHGGYWSVELHDGFRYALYENEITKIEEEENG